MIVELSKGAYEWGSYKLHGIYKDGEEIVKAEIKAIEFKAEVRQVKTMADGSVNIILNLPEHCREQAKVVMDWHHLVVRGMLAVEESNGDFTEETRKIHI